MAEKRRERPTASSVKPFVISGCSGGGKSTLLTELESRGHFVVPEAGRRVVATALETQTDALPWVNPEAFVRACVTLHLADLKSCPEGLGSTYLDRSLVDVISFLSFKSLPVPTDLASLLTPGPYAVSVFMAPVWAELFVNDAERQHSLEEAEAEYHHLRTCYVALGYRLIDLPRVSVTERAEFVEDRSRI